MLMRALWALEKNVLVPGKALEKSWNSVSKKASIPTPSQSDIWGKQRKFTPLDQFSFSSFCGPQKYQRNSNRLKVIKNLAGYFGAGDKKCHRLEKQ